MGTRNGFITIVCRERIFILWNKTTHMSKITAGIGAITMNTVKALLLPTTPATARAIPAEMRDLKTSLLIQI